MARTQVSSKPFTILAGAAIVAAAVLVAGATMTVAPRKAEANPAYASQTGQPCAKCHSAPPKLNAVGQKFKKNGFKM